MLYLERPLQGPLEERRGANARQSEEVQRARAPKALMDPGAADMQCGSALGIHCAYPFRKKRSPTDVRARKNNLPHFLPVVTCSVLPVVVDVLEGR